MNNLETQCVDFLFDILANRPKDFSGKTVQYNKGDREQLLTVCNAYKKVVENHKKDISYDRYSLLMNLYDIVLELLNNSII